MESDKLSFVEELRWRGMLYDAMPGTAEQLEKEMTVGYVGFDPTADSLHIGNLVPIMMLKHLQLKGHKPIALVGGATGMIGDPSGKSAERNLLSEDILLHNLSSQKKQLEKFLDFDCGPNSAEIVNNYDWFKEFNTLDFLREVGKHITVSYMMAKDSVQKRLETGISFTEFSYQLIQGYDFYWLYKHMGCKLQMGASDQWGNIVTGTELIRRKSGGEAFALTCGLITKADGQKFGKSESGSVWLDPKRTTPFQFYQFWVNASDIDASRFIRIFTLLGKEEIENLEAEHAQALHLRILQKALAKDVTIRVHSEEDYNRAIETTEILFGKGTIETLRKLSVDEVVDACTGFQNFFITQDKIDAGINIVDLLSVDTQIFPSKGEARKMIQGGGVSINKEKLGSVDIIINADALINGAILLVQKGKKDYYLIRIA